MVAHHLGGPVCLQGRSWGNELYLAFAPRSSAVAVGFFGLFVSLIQDLP